LYNRGSLHILAAILVALLVAAVGVAVYNIGKSGRKTVAVSSSSQTTSSSPSPTANPESTATPVPSDDSLIATAVKADIARRGPLPPAGSKIILGGLEGNYAVVNVAFANGPGYFDLLKKSNESWSVVSSGQNVDPASEASLERDGFPQDFFTGGGPDQQSVVLFTY
jgi:hypothetical protein